MAKPPLNTWYDATGYGIGDRCACDFGTFAERRRCNR